ncbi:MAG TPA: hypothetical protein VH518_08860, partial [Tepidisphaeraceae bacterium]
MWSKVALIIAFAAALAVLVIVHAPGLNGPSYWLWPWREPVLPAGRWYLAMAVAAMPGLLALWFSRNVVLIILMLMLSTFAMRVASVTMVRGWFDTSLVADILKSPEATSYYADAAALSTYDHWLRDYPDILYNTSLHTQSKPPGPVLYWMTIVRLFGYNDRAAVIGAMILGALATLSIPMTFLLVKQLTQNRDASLLAAAWVSLAPGFVLFFPMFDPIYLVFSCTLVMLWHGAVSRDSFFWAGAFGLVLGISTFATYLVLILGPFPFLLGLLCAGRKPAEAMKISIKLGLLALAVFVAFYLLLWMTTGFNVVATFSEAWKNQQLFLQRHESARRYPMTVPFDLLDFLLGAGWISALVVIFAFTPSPCTQGEGRGEGSALTRGRSDEIPRPSPPPEYQ